jgi:hypothetical protein
MKGLRIVFLVQGIYLTILGLMFWFFPSVAEAIFQYTMKDPVLTPLFGQVLLTVAIVCYIVARDVKGHTKLTWALVFENIGHIVVFVYLLVTGEAGFVTLGPPLIISAILLVLFLYFFRLADR